MRHSAVIALLARFATDKLVLIVARHHALSGRRRVALRDVVEQDFIGLSAGSALQDYLGEQALFAGQPFYFRARVRTFDNICSMVEQGAGLGIVPATAAKRYPGDAGRAHGRVDRPLGDTPVADLRARSGCVATAGTRAGRGACCCLQSALK